MSKQLLRDAVSIMETWWAKFPQDMSESDRTVLTRMQAEIDAPDQEPFAWAWEVNPESDFQKRKGGKSGVWLTNPADDGINIHSDQSILHYKWTLLYTKPQPAAVIPEQPIHGWMTDGSSRVTFGEFAEQDAKAEAKRCGGTCEAYPVYRGPQPVYPVEKEKK